MKANVWIRECASGGCVEVMWTTASDTANSCVEVADDSACGKVLIRDSKRGNESPVLEFTPAGWREFTATAVDWDGETTVRGGGFRLMNTQGIGASLPVCISDDRVRHLHFDWDEWRAFARGIVDGKFDVEVPT